ncbi:MAG: aspartyl protease family protein [Sphingomonadales bacterium]|nr:aspartyl protease family protein [Sphingomonadales bacterium]MDE2570546.1 aspartyl protease family protein [Sphingomonadales bacterium]
MPFHPIFAATGAAMLPLLGAYPVSALQDAAPGVSQTEVVEVQKDLNLRMTVPVHIADNGPFHFLIDTGAERTVLSRDVASQLKLTPVSKGTLIGIAGSQAVDIVDVDQIDLGRRSFYGLSAPLLDEANIGADGIIGLDSLQGQRVLLDFDHNRMAIGDAHDLGGNYGYEIVVRARRQSGQLIMTNALVDGVRTDVIIDTGAETSIGNVALQTALRKRHPDMQTQLISVTGQQITAGVGMARRLELGGLTLTNTVIAFAAAPPFEKLGLDKRPALLLGMTQLRLFHRVAIDFDSRKVMFDLPDDAMASTRRNIGSRLLDTGY